SGAASAWAGGTSATSATERSHRDAPTPLCLVTMALGVEGVALRRDPLAEIGRVDPVRLRQVVPLGAGVAALAVAAAGGRRIGDEHLVAARVVADDRDVVVDRPARRIPR